eukprot:Nitzschia sp. Nitz4//scaffold284_size24204//6850//8820//NITZ4_008414-RA/size24204-processed-gene-0.7-mRNA-1//-1//CDS//3329545682//7935//frame0
MMDDSDEFPSPSRSQSNDDSLESPEMGEEVASPNENDVLCGRGGSINSHKGNEQFRQLVEKRKRVYLTARFKREKRLIASSIVTEIRNMNPQGRFLARKGNKDTGVWYDIGDEKARDKTSQALRENAPSIRAKIETEINQQREEIKRKDVAVPNQHPSAPAYPVPSSHPFYPPPPPHQAPPQQQSYWDWYYHYYGYPAPPPGAPGYPPPPPHPAMAGAPPPPPHAYWGQPPPTHAPSPMKQEPETKDAGAVAVAKESDDRRFALELQRQENFTAPRRGHNPATPERPRNTVKVQHNAEEDRLTQEQRDHRLALALQEQEDNHLRHQLTVSGNESRRTSRSNAYSQVTRVARDRYSASETSSSQMAQVTLDQNLPAQLVAWVTSDPSIKTKEAPDRQRSVQFKEQAAAQNAQTGPSRPEFYRRQSSAASTESRPLQPQAEPNASLLSQVATHILGWDSHAMHSDSKLPAADNDDCMEDNDEPMDAEGLEVQLRDVNNETSMPPPEPRIQEDWHSRTGSCHSWIPETFGAAWAGATHSIGGGSTLHEDLSPVNSLVMMDGSINPHNMEHGATSLSQILDNDDSLQRALRTEHSWERSMQLSITSVEGDESSFIRRRDYKPSRNHLPHRPGGNGSSVRLSGSGNYFHSGMDWESHPEHG